jgi:hypothetical protein
MLPPDVLFSRGASPLRVEPLRKKFLISIGVTDKAARTEILALFEPA